MFNNNELHKVELTNHLVHFVSVDMYQKYDPDFIWTIDDFESELESFSQFDDAESFRNYFYEHFDNGAYEDHILKCAKEVFNESYLPDLKEIMPLVVKGEIESIDSPKTYNYTTDRLDFNLYFSKDLQTVWTKFKKAIQKDTEKFNDYLHENFRSRPGFSSFMPQSISDIDQIISYGKDDDDITRAFGAILSYILNNYQDKDSYHESMMYKVLEAGSMLDYVNDNFNKMLDTVNENVKYIKSFKKFKQ